MKNVIIVAMVVLFSTSSISCANGNAENQPEPTAINSVNSEVKDAGVIHLDKAAFLEKVFDFENNKEWNYKGDVPAIVDFYADWCGPCRMLSPVLKELQSEYGGKIQIYKIDTDKEKELAASFGIQSLPTIVFIPKDGQPQAVMGFRPKEELEKVISEVLKVEK